MSAVVITAMCLMGVAVVAGVFWGFQTSLDMLMGAAVILVPSVWVAASLTSGRSVMSPIWMGLARYSFGGGWFCDGIRTATRKRPGCGVGWKRVGAALTSFNGGVAAAAAGYEDAHRLKGAGN